MGAGGVWEGREPESAEAQAIIAAPTRATALGDAGQGRPKWRCHTPEKITWNFVVAPWSNPMRESSGA